MKVALRHKWLVGTMVFVLLIFGPLSCLDLRAESASEREIQAAIIIKFTDFITWPEDSYTDNAAPFTIGIIGDDDYSDLFEPFLGRQFQQRDFNVHHFKKIAEIDKPQILIINVSERHRVGDILARMAGKPVVTIGDFPGFSEAGGMINFYRKPNNRIGFKINMETKQKSGLKISSFFMKMGKIVHSGNGGNE
jgi:hypothetical protein